MAERAAQPQHARQEGRGSQQREVAGGLSRVQKQEAGPGPLLHDRSLEQPGRPRGREAQDPHGPTEQPAGTRTGREGQVRPGHGHAAEERVAAVLWKVQGTVALWAAWLVLQTLGPGHQACRRELGRRQAPRGPGRAGRTARRSP